jgi:magnesium-protoporphyrin O-methyltransferase
VQDVAIPGSPTLLDVGGGIGAIHHQLLAAGFAHATHVDASTAYLAAAESEARRLNHADRVTFRHADFRASAAEIPAADVVTLDRVVCCDPDHAGMLGAAAAHARRAVAFSYPRDRASVRLVLAMVNAWLRLRRSSFRVFVHPPAAMTAVLEAAGLRRRYSGGTFVWAVELFERPA